MVNLLAPKRPSSHPGAPSHATELGVNYRTRPTT
jgi:hypothetical protein